ncbi:MAG: hypothetical protein JSS66_07635 [Armatimonadetes bacterium]|nr:hypothetical protein [Armatimonadota bacterium]
MSCHAALLFLLGLLNLGTKPVSDKLYFLNTPETVRASGLLAEGRVPAGTNARFFFHFVNATHKTQQFDLEGPNKNGFDRYGMSVDTSPSNAGASAMYAFLMNPAPDRRQVLSVTVPAWHTVSGIAETVTADTGTYRCSMGNGDLVRGANVLVSETLCNTVEMELTSGLHKFRYGGAVIGGQKGEYGIGQMYRFRNTTKKALRVVVSVSPRGGNGCVVYRLNNTVKRTGRLLAKSVCRLAGIDLWPGQYAEFFTMPAGGMSYPVELTCEVRAI